MKFFGERFSTCWVFWSAWAQRPADFLWSRSGIFKSDHGWQVAKSQFWEFACFGVKSLFVGFAGISEKPSSGREVDLKGALSAKVMMFLQLDGARVCRGVKNRHR